VRTHRLAFLVTNLATSVTGLFFPIVRFLTSPGVGVLSLLVLAWSCPRSAGSTSPAAGA
jgi:hypothetical protein